MTNDKMIINTVIISAGFFCVLFAVVAAGFVLNKLGFELDSVYLLIALIPFIILLVLSGKLKEIQGPGGIGFTLRDEAKRQVSPELTSTPVQVEPHTVMTKSGTIDLPERIAREHPTTLSFELGGRMGYTSHAIEYYITELEKAIDFRLVLFTDVEGRFKGCMKAADYKSLLKRRFDDMAGMIESGDILKQPNVITSRVRADFTNKQALDEMDKYKANMLAVVDKKGKFVGVVTQDEIVRKILSRVLGAA